MACSRSIDLEMFSFPKLETLLCNECWMFLTDGDFKTIFKSNYLKKAFISSRFELMDDVVDMFKEYEPYFKPEIHLWFYKIDEDYECDDIIYIQRTFKDLDIQPYFMLVFEESEVQKIQFEDFDGETERGNNVVIEYEVHTYEDILTLEEFTSYPSVKGYSLKVDLKYVTDIDIFKENFLMEKPVSEYVSTLIFEVNSSCNVPFFSHQFPFVEDLVLKYSEEDRYSSEYSSRWINLNSLTLIGEFPPDSIDTKHFANYIKKMFFDGDVFTEDLILDIIESNKTFTDLKIEANTITSHTTTSPQHYTNLKVLSLHISQNYSFVIKNWFKSTPKLEVLHLLGNGELDISIIDILLHHSPLNEFRMSINISHLAKSYKELLDRIENFEVVKLFIYPAKDLTSSDLDLEILKLEQLTSLDGFENVLVSPINEFREMSIKFEYLDVRREFVIDFKKLFEFFS